MLPPVLTHRGRTILFVMAAEAEYGPALRARFTPLMTGVGPVEGGTVTARALALAQAAGQAPDLVVSLGSAGSARLPQCGVFQASAVAYRDMDASAFGFARGETPFLGLPRLVPLAPMIPGLAQATLSTGANVVSGRAYDAIAEDMVDMETFAILRACQGAGVPLAALRGISDGQAPLTGMADWTEYLHIIDEKLALAVDALLDWTARGGLTP